MRTKQERRTEKIKQLQDVSFTNWPIMKDKVLKVLIDSFSEDTAFLTLENIYDLISLLEG